MHTCVSELNAVFFVSLIRFLMWHVLINITANFLHVNQRLKWLKICWYYHFKAKLSNKIREMPWLIIIMILVHRQHRLVKYQEHWTVDGDLEQQSGQVLCLREDDGTLLQDPGDHAWAGGISTSGEVFQVQRGQKISIRKSSRVSQRRFYWKSVSQARSSHRHQRNLRFSET